MQSLFRGRSARVFRISSAFFALTSTPSFGCSQNSLVQVDCITKHPSSSAVNAYDRMKGHVDPSQWVRYNAHSREIDRAVTEKREAQIAAQRAEMEDRSARAKERMEMERIAAQNARGRGGGVFSEKRGTFSEQPGTFSDNPRPSRKSTSVDQSARPPIINTTTGEALTPAGPNYVGTRDGRVYVPVGNGLIDTRTGQFMPTH